MSFLSPINHVKALNKTKSTDINQEKSPTSPIRSSSTNVFLKKVALLP